MSDTIKRKRTRLSPSSSGGLRISPSISSSRSQPLISGGNNGGGGGGGGGGGASAGSGGGSGIINGPRSASPAITTTSTNSITAPTTKQRREALSGQLPLTPGRSVAFRLPAKAAAVKGEEEGEVWILARIERCINSDKSRYVVRDVDEVDAIYNTTIKSIVPLPDPTTSPTSPSHPNQYYDHPRGSQVLAIYPDTTSFYRATVLIPPIPGTGNGIGVGGMSKAEVKEARKGRYVLRFEDDDVTSQEVGAGFVVEYPGAN